MATVDCLLRTETANWQKFRRHFQSWERKTRFDPCKRRGKKSPEHLTMPRRLRGRFYWRSCKQRIREADAKQREPRATAATEAALAQGRQTKGGKLDSFPGSACRAVSAEKWTFATTGYLLGTVHTRVSIGSRERREPQRQPFNNRRTERSNCFVISIIFLLHPHQTR